MASDHHGIYVSWRHYALYRRKKILAWKSISRANRACVAQATLPGALSSIWPGLSYRAKPVLVCPIRL